MSKIAFATDVHVGNHRQHGGPITVGMNMRCRLVLEVLKRCMDIVYDEGIDWFEILGDLLDIDRPPPQLIAALQELFPDPSEAATSGLGPIVALLLGNHEQRSAEDGDHALGPFQDRCAVIDKPLLTHMRNIDLIHIPFQPGAATDWLGDRMKEVVPEKYDSPRILTLHLGVMDEETPPYLQHAHDAIHVDELEVLCKKHRIRHVFTGNWHDARHWEAGTDKDPIDIWQVGTLCPTGWDNPGFKGYGRLAIYDTESGEVELREIPGPRFIKTIEIDGPESGSWNKTARQIHRAAKKGHKVFLRVTTDPKFVAAFIEQVEAGKEAGWLIDGRVLAEDTEVQEAAVKAAHAAKATDDFDASIRKYVKNMPLNEDVSRDSVLERTMTYLSRSKDG